jgi:hypothetical protein
MGNPNHGSDGRFVSGSAGAAASGDHQAVSPRADVRNVSGHAIPRSQVVTRHGGAQSVNTEGAPRLTGAAAERVALNRQLDARSYPTRTDADVAAKTDLMGPRKITPGKLDPRLSTLVKGGAKPRVRAKVSNARTNAVMSASGRPTPRTQPSAGQLIGARIITGS